VAKPLENGASVRERDDHGQTALHIAADMGIDSIVLLLLDKGADAQLNDYAGRMPLRRAIQNNHEAVIKLLPRTPPARENQFNDKKKGEIDRDT